MKIGADTSAVITGGASGLGAAAARALAARGAPVTLLDLNADTGANLAAELGGRFVLTDVTDPAQVASALEGTAPRICLTCAGIAPGGRTVSRDGTPHDAEMFQRAVAINLMGTFHALTQSAALMAGQEPLDKDGSRGVLISTASIAAYEGQIGQIAYAATKGAVASMTLPMARDLASAGIRVNSVAPGMFKTPMVAGLPPETQERLGAAVPFPARLGDPEEFAALVVHIVENQMLNGATLRLDGAIRLPPK